MQDWLGVTFVSKAASECNRVEAQHFERQALKKKRSLACVMREYYYFFLLTYYYNNNHKQI